MIEESQVSSGPTMMFATLDYEGCCTKNETEKIGTRWAGLLRTAGMDISTYVIEENQVLFSSQAGLHAGEIKDYVLKQPECVAVDWNSKRTEGPAWSPEWQADYDAKKADKEAKRVAKEEEEARVKKAEEKLKKKRKRKKKAAAAAAKDEV
jgi:hypothetical protein